MSPCGVPMPLWGPRVPTASPAPLTCSPSIPAVPMPVPALGCPKTMPPPTWGWGPPPPPAPFVPFCPPVTALTWWRLRLGPDSLGFLPAGGLAGFLLPPNVLDWGQGGAMTEGVRGGGEGGDASVCVPPPSHPICPPRHRTVLVVLPLQLLVVVQRRRLRLRGDLCGGDTGTWDTGGWHRGDRGRWHRDAGVASGGREVAAGQGEVVTGRGVVALGCWGDTGTRGGGTGKQGGGSRSLGGDTGDQGTALGTQGGGTGDQGTALGWREVAPEGWHWDTARGHGGGDRGWHWDARRWQQVTGR